MSSVLKPKRILLVCLRRLGDVLLTTPLAGSLRQAYPDCRIDWLVFESTAGILVRNPAADRILTLPDRPTATQTFKAILKILGRYDIGISAQAGDRPSLFARLAGPKAYGLASEASGGPARDALMTAVAPSRARCHQAQRILDVADLLGIARKNTVLVPQPRDWSELQSAMQVGLKDSSPGGQELTPSSYWVLHPGAAFPYKQWCSQGWVALIEHLRGAGVAVCISGGPGLAEDRYLSALFDSVTSREQEQLKLPPIIPIWRAGMDWPSLATLLVHSKGFVGVDTSVTHLAAALGIPTVPIFGPTDPLLWAPIGVEGKPLDVLQNRAKTCVPCQLEGCDRHTQSRSACLDELNVGLVIEYMKKMPLRARTP